MDNNQQLYWYLVRTKTGKERWVRDQLANVVPEVFLPMLKAKTPRWGRMAVSIAPLFPCYVFFHGSHERRATVLSTPGVHSIVGFAGQPAVIEKCQIDAIRLAVESHLRVEPHPFLRHGDQVRVKFGPLTGIEGILIRKRGFERLIISAELLQKSVSVEVDASCIERIGSGPCIELIDSNSHKRTEKSRELV